MKKLFITILIILSKASNASSITIPQSSIANNAKNCITKIICKEGEVTQKDILDNLYRISSYLQTHCQTDIGTNKGTLHLENVELRDFKLEKSFPIKIAILEKIAQINNSGLDINTIKSNQLEEIFLTMDYLLIDIIELLRKNTIRTLTPRISNSTFELISPDSKFIVSFDRVASKLRIINLKKNTIFEISGIYSDIQISANSKFIIAYNESLKSLDIIDLYDGSTKYKEDTQSNPSTQISLDGEFFVIYNEKNHALEIKRLHKNNTIKVEYEYNNIKISPDSKFIVAYNEELKSLEIMDYQGYTIKRIPGEYNKLIISPNSQFLATYNGSDDLLRIIDNNGNIIKELKIKCKNITISPDSKFIIVYNYENKSLDIIDPQGTIVKQVKGEYKNIKISPDGNFIVAYDSKDKKLKIITSTQIIEINQEYASDSINISPNSQFVVAYNEKAEALEVINPQGVVTNQIKGNYSSLSENYGDIISSDSQFIIAYNNKFQNESLDIINYKGEIINKIRLKNGATKNIISPDNKFILHKNLNDDSLFITEINNSDRIHSVLLKNASIIPSTFFQSIKRYDEKLYQEIIREIISNALKQTT